MAGRSGSEAGEERRISMTCPVHGNEREKKWPFFSPLEKSKG